jgi:8-oxo-dGTP pyrophosphatase MutT (NUDIX family)
MKEKEDKSSIACVFSKEKNKVLLVKRRDVPVWVLPGGGIEKNETAEETIIREVKEETGFNVKITKKIGEYTPVNRLSRFTYLFECEVISGKETTSSETKEVKFFEIKDIPMMPPPYKDWIEDCYKNPKVPLNKKLTQVTYFKLFLNMILHPILVFRFLLSRIGLSINT